MRILIFLLSSFCSSCVFANDQIDKARELTARTQINIPIDFGSIINTISSCLLDLYCSWFGFIITLFVIFQIVDNIFKITEDSKSRKNENDYLTQKNSLTSMFSYSDYKSDDEIFEAEGKRKKRAMRKERERKKLVESGRNSLLYGDDYFD